MKASEINLFPSTLFPLIAKKTSSFLIVFELIEILLILSLVGIAEFGLFCEIDKYFISGLVHVSDLKRDRYIFDNQANILKGRKTGKTYRIGQKIRVQLANVIPEERKIILVPSK